MACRHRGSAIFLACLAATALASAQSSAQTNVGASAATPRTPWGDPDLQGTYTNHEQVPLERPAQYADRPFLTDEELAAIETRATQGRDRPPAPGQVGAYNDFWNERGKRSNRTGMIVDPPDGRLPPMTPQAKQIMDRISATRRAGTTTGSWEDRDTYERCITRGMPGVMVPGFYNHNYQILQVPGYVVIYAEMIHDARIIPLDKRPHLSQNVRQWLGDPRGHWEGNTLVVETTNFDGRAGIIRQPADVVFGTSAKGRVIERFTRLDANTLDYRFTVDDPETFTKPWTALSLMMRIEDQIFEYACHEGNYAIRNILSTSAPGGEAEGAARK